MKTYLAIDLGGYLPKYALVEENGSYHHQGKVPTRTVSKTCGLPWLILAKSKSHLPNRRKWLSVHQELSTARPGSLGVPVPCPIFTDLTSKKRS